MKTALLALAVAFICVANYCKFKQSLGLDTGGCFRAFNVKCEDKGEDIRWH